MKRMQAFQARSGIQETAGDEHDDQEEEQEEQPEQSQSQESSDFYKSYYEEEERKQKEAATEAEKEVKPEEDAEEKSVKPPPRKLIDITDKKPEVKSSEELAGQGVGYWAKICESQGDFDAKPPEASGDDKVKDDAEEPPVEERRRTRSQSRSTYGTKDLPGKAQVDAQQKEQETWADRWYQNKKVQKVVKHSKMLSKVKANIKVKLKPEDQASGSTPAVAEEHPGTSAGALKAEALRRKAANKNPSNKDLPKVIGSMDEYSKLLEKKAATSGEDPEQQKADSADSESEDEGDDLWGAIMGKSS